MSISPFNSCFDLRIGFGSGGQKVGLPSKRGLHACAGGVTGAVPHIVKKNSGSIKSLFIILFHDDHWSNDSMKLTKVFLTILCILTRFFFFSHWGRNDRISVYSISQLTQKSIAIISLCSHYELLS